MTDDEVTVRQAKSGDAPGISRLASELGYPVPVSGMERRLERVLADQRHYVVVVAEKTGDLLAWMHVEHRSSIEEGERAELIGLVVASAARRRGFGRQLVDEAERWARDRGLSELTVRTNLARKESHPFYERLGYLRKKTQHFYVKTMDSRQFAEEES